MPQVPQQCRCFYLVSYVCFRVSNKRFYSSTNIATIEAHTLANRNREYACLFDTKPLNMGSRVNATAMISLVVVTVYGQRDLPERRVGPQPL